MSARLKSVFFFLFLLFNFSLAVAQKQRADSLFQILATKNLPDTARIYTLLELSDFYSEVIADTALLFAQQAKDIVDQKKLDRLLPKVLRTIAIANVVKGDYSGATIQLRQAISKCGADSSRYFKKEKALAYNLLGVIFDYQANSDSSLVYYFKALDIFKKLNERGGIANRLNNIATVYFDMANYPLALKYFFEGFQLSPTPRMAQNIGRTYVSMKEGVKAKEYLLLSLVLYDQDNEYDNTGVAIVNEELGSLYTTSGNFDSAAYFLSRALRINERAKFNNGIARDHYLFGVIYKARRLWANAKDEAKLALNLHLQVDEKLGVAESTLLLAEANFQLNQIDVALKQAHQGNELAREIKTKNVQKGYLELLSTIYAAQKNFVQAYNFSSQLSVLKDSINNDEKIKQVANMEALYENDKKEKELALVRAQKLTADAQLSAEETKTALSTVGLVLVSLVLVVGAFSFLALKRSRRLLETKNEELRKLNETKDRFFAIVGHDLRGPITSFSGINDLLNWHISKNDLDKVKAMGNKITQSVRQLDTLLNNLLNWAMSQTDAVPYRPEPLQLNQLTKECCSHFEHSLHVKQVALRDQTPDDFFVFADKNALASVLRNLISNAIKFTPANGEIKIAARQAGNMIWVDVSDTGVGVAEEKLKTLFGLSENKTTSGTAGEKGTGLGLVLCADYVALNKGEIKVTSKVSVGTQFSFSVPSFQPTELQRLKQEMIHG